MQGGGRAYVVAFASGALLSFAFPEPDLFFLAWFSIAPLLVLLRDAGSKRGFGLGFAFGLGFFGLLLYWISIIGFIGWVVLVLLQAAFVGGFGAFTAVATRRAVAWERIALGALLWVLIVELFRATFPVVGFTWGELAQSQHNVGYLLKSAGIFGGWGVAGLLVAVNGCIAEIVAAFRSPEWKRYVAAALVLLAAPVLVPTPRATGTPLRVAIVQGNIPREMEASFEKDVIILNNHVELTRNLDTTVDLVVWPESSVGIDPFGEPTVGETIGEAARAVGASMIVGGNLDRDDDRYQVMAYQVSPEGEFVDRYQKTHLVPFGEYVPARALLDWIPALDQVPRDAVPGREETLFDLEGDKVAPVLSFEGDFGGLVQGRIAAGGRLLVVATNTSTWEDSWASAQHLAMSQVRAAENGVYVVHGALTGISALIAPSGRVIERTELWEPESLIADVRFAESVTLFARFGDRLPFVLIFGVAALLIRLRRRGTTVL
jgi:apolipoprotein N-acyltransferase